MNKTSLLFSLVLNLSLLFVFACGSQEVVNNDTESGRDSNTNGDAGPDSGTDVENVENDYYPMAVGAFWKYRETQPGLTPIELTYTITKKEKKTFGDITGEREVFFMENTFDVNEEYRVQYIEDDGVRAVRHGHDVYTDEGWKKVRTYTPGFLRFDRGKVAVGEKWEETVSSVTVDAKETKTQTTTYEFEVLRVGTPVTIGIGTFNCIQLKRKDSADSETKLYWYAPGIGKIREQTLDTSKEEELIDSSYL